jgi:hypothetical protein
VSARQRFAKRCLGKEGGDPSQGWKTLLAITQRSIDMCVVPAIALRLSYWLALLRHSWPLPPVSASASPEVAARQVLTRSGIVWPTPGIFDAFKK